MRDGVGERLMARVEGFPGDLFGPHPHAGRTTRGFTPACCLSPQLAACCKAHGGSGHVGTRAARLRLAASRALTAAN